MEPDTTLLSLLHSSLHHPTVATGVFQKTCIICNHIRKSVKGKKKIYSRSLCNRHSREVNEDAAAILGDSAMLAKTGSINFAAKEVKYLYSCRKAYIKANDHIEVESKPSSEYAETRDLYGKCFFILDEYIKSSVTEAQRAEFITFHSREMAILIENGILSSTYSSQKLGGKIILHFKVQLNMISSKKQENALYCTVVIFNRMKP